VNPTPAHPNKKMERHSVESSHCSGSLQKNVSQRDSTLSIFCASHSASTDCLFWYLSLPKNRSSCSPQNKKERGRFTEKRGASKSIEKYEMSSRILRSASKSMQKHPRCFEDSMRSDQMFANVCSYAQCESVRLTCIDTQNHTNMTAGRCQKMHRRGGLSLVRCSPILAVYFYLLCRSRHSSQTCIGICRFQKRADVLVTTTPKSKNAESRPLYF